MLEARIDADLDDGRHAELVGELEALVAAPVHREGLQAHRIIALYRSGRQADALAAYRDARAALDELGLDPSARAAHRSSSVSSATIPTCCDSRLPSRRRPPAPG